LLEDAYAKEILLRGAMQPQVLLHRLARLTDSWRTDEATWSSAARDVMVVVRGSASALSASAADIERSLEDFDVPAYRRRYAAPLDLDAEEL
jgi:hypothetical protein